MHVGRDMLALVAILTVTSAPLSEPLRAQIAVGVSIRIAPPLLPVYVQPPIPGPDYIWVPGYWAWGDDDYYWVPGTWVLAPYPGLLWTPGYWGWRDGIYVWNAGYWGPHVGYYGGINYGCGYTGVGFQGGYWRGGVFVYNRAVTNVGSVRITNVYNKTIINNTTVTNVSFNGGAGGTKAHPTAGEQAAAHENHVPATDLQTKHQQAASSNRASFASVNRGHPGVAATATAGVLAGAGVVAAKGAKAGPGLNASKSSSGQAVIKQGTAAKLTDPAGPKRFGNSPPGGAGQRYSTHPVTTPKGFGPQSGNYPPGAAGQRYPTRQATTPKGFGSQSGNYPPGAAGQKYTTRQAITPKGSGPQSGNYPHGAAGQRTRQTATPKGFGPQPPPRQAVGQARRPDQHGGGKKPDTR
jgi:WXXGXW repeat (2 copies)